MLRKKTIAANQKRAQLYEEVLDSLGDYVGEQSKTIYNKVGESGALDFFKSLNGQNERWLSTIKNLADLNFDLYHSEKKATVTKDIETGLAGLIEEMKKAAKNSTFLDEEQKADNLRQLDVLSAKLNTSPKTKSINALKSGANLVQTLFQQNLRKSSSPKAAQQENSQKKLPAEADIFARKLHRSFVRLQNKTKNSPDREAIHALAEKIGKTINNVGNNVGQKSPQVELEKLKEILEESKNKFAVKERSNSTNRLFARLKSSPREDCARQIHYALNEIEKLEKKYELNISVPVKRK